MNTQTTEVSPRPTATENRATVAQKRKTRTPHVDILETPEAFLVRPASKPELRGIPCGPRCGFRRGIPAKLPAPARDRPR